MTKKDKILSEIIRLTNAADPKAEVYLYGSQARGNPHRLSDWDLLILLNINNIPFALETSLMDQIYDIELESGEIISPLIYSKKDWEEKHYITPLFENIKNEGIRIQ
ncbi:MAG TPA: nucleotidyltransferase domain-containing protein [Bacteroidales bacterium]|nr:nucleotidyltransferase domain-containing protein [Bacteroidales bacterium]HPT02582.1 nucleotidyltransferase domain-containing protein [Bacteroidales bacterium]